MSMELRKSIIDFIRLISSSQKQFEYENNVSIANVSSELICMWFDDLYHSNSELFLNSFSAKELEDLSLFNEFYDLRVKDIPSSDGVKGLLENKSWLEVQSHANALLNKYTW
ncbi:hypothetical protein [Colwellia psychrerythraea]|uniref:Uncharacterized protein n=1 Tax=Colwellia psychrerythraea TaxID=28229 RepID=A0A099KQ42_COLPS|nr:hypothetical protein [Colwellia psychrerythraea]KGJ91758.1 hypothetical protein GAB14E_3240 [Colwellia psychrerythraea]